MSHKLSLLIVLCCLASHGFAHDESAAESSSEVIVATDNNFDDLIKQHEVLLVDFYAPWCGHCKTLEPEFAKAALELKGKVALVKVDATAESGLAQRFNVKGFPTLKLFKDGEESEYKGGRNSEGIVSYMQKQIGPAMKTLQSKADAETLIASNKYVVIGFFDKNLEHKDVYTAVCKKNRDDYIFGAADSSVRSALGLASTAEVVAFRTFDDGNKVFDGEFDVATLSKWIESNSFAVVDEIGPDNYEKYLQRGLPFLWLFVNNTRVEEKDDAIAKLRTAAESFKNQYSFVFLDGVKYEGQLTNVGLSGKVLPAAALVVKNSKYVYDESKPVTAEGLVELLRDYEAGKLTPVFKSEEVPEANDQPVKVIVGKSFEKEVLKSGKDVLIEFYAPWCGHCKKLEPIYDQLAKTLEDVDSVVIAKIDGTANEVPFPGFETSGFPTILFVKSSDPANPIPFEGDRTVDGMIDFLSKNAATPFDAPLNFAALHEDLDDFSEIVTKMKSILLQHKKLLAENRELKRQLASEVGNRLMRAAEAAAQPESKGVKTEL
eukprot:GILK01001919.1.p1 GENE.GILK01001919.1~~GILK01001919.1.p1  ORF type:complete len:556 (+),score=125.00 GILK01001919.1:28-1668(+)